MVNREFWQNLIESAWKQRSIVWLSGVRRAGKTSLCRSLSRIEYFDCERPSVRQQLEDPEFFLESHQNQRLVLDEIHRLANPSELLKIAADHYPSIKIIATGSSSLGASAKFSDTLAGRKVNIWLPPMLSIDSAAFGNMNLEHRLLYGGLPPFFISSSLPQQEYEEWLNAYWAKDIQTLFRLEKRYAFQRFLELLFIQSGSIFEATWFAQRSEISRTTIINYLTVLEETYTMHVIRPFNTRRSSEIVSTPKVYSFDTGFVCYQKGWKVLRNEDLGLLWEHYVLNEMQGRLQTRQILYWRDKRGHEIDFIYLNKDRKKPIVIECKWSSKKFIPNNIKIFRKQYMMGENFVVASDIKTSYSRRYDDIIVHFVTLEDLVKKLC